MFLTGQVTRDHLSGWAQGACIGHMDSSLVLSVMGPKSLISVSIQFLRSEEATGQSNTAAAFLEPPHHWESSYSPLTNVRLLCLLLIHASLSFGARR